MKMPAAFSCVGPVARCIRIVFISGCPALSSRGLSLTHIICGDWASGTVWEQYFHKGQKRPKHAVRTACGTTRVKTLLFDMDNTLFDLVEAKHAACRAITDELGVGSPEHLFSYFLRRTRGFEDPENIRDFMADAGLSSKEVFTRCCAIYRDVKLSRIAPYPGVPETLIELAEREFLLILVTDAHHRDAVPRLEKTGLLPMFDHIVTYDMTWQKKPSPVPFLYALQIAGTDAENAMVIGDSPGRDIAPGNELGMYTVYARYGDRFSSGRDTGNAQYIIDDIRDLPVLLEGLVEDPGRRELPCAAGSPSH